MADKSLMDAFGYGSGTTGEAAPTGSLADAFGYGQAPSPADLAKKQNAATAKNLAVENQKPLPEVPSSGLASVDIAKDFSSVAPQAGPDDSTLKKVGKGVLRFGAGILGLPVQAVDAASKSLADSGVTEEDAFKAGQYGKMLFSQLTSGPKAMLDAANEVAIKPQTQLFNEGLQQAITPPPPTPEGLVNDNQDSNKEGMARMILGGVPVLGPVISQSADEISQGDLPGGLTNLALNAAAIAAGAQKPSAAVELERAKSALVDATHARTQALGLNIPKEVVAEKLLPTVEGKPAVDIQDTAKAATQGQFDPFIQKQFAPLREAASSQLPNVSEPPIQEQPQPQIEAKVPETNPAIPNADLAKIDKGLQKAPEQPVLGNLPQEGQPVPALISDAEHQQLEKAGFTVDSKGRLARLVQKVDERPIGEGFPVTEKPATEAPSATATPSGEDIAKPQEAAPANTILGEKLRAAIEPAARRSALDKTLNQFAEQNFFSDPTGQMSPADFMAEQLRQKAAQGKPLTPNEKLALKALAERDTLPIIEPKTGIAAEPTPKLQPEQVVSDAPPATESTPQSGRDKSALKTNLLKNRKGVDKAGERGAVDPTIFGAPLEAGKKLAEEAAGGKGILAAAGNEQKTGGPPPTRLFSAKPPEGELPKYAGSINLERLNTPEEVKRAVLDQYTQDQTQVDTARKNPVSFEETKKQARDLGWDADKVSKLNKSALNSQEITAARQVNLAQIEQVTKLKKAYDADPSTKGLIDLQKAISESAATSLSVQKYSAEAGRSLNAHKIYAEAARLAKTNVQQAIELLQKTLGDKWEANAKSITEQLAQIPDGDTVALNRFLRKYADFTTADKIKSYYVANLLSGVQTNVKNFIGNVTMVPLETSVKLIKGAIDPIAAKVQGRPREFYTREGLYSLAGRVSGLKEGFSTALQILKEGMTQEQSAKLEMPRHFEFQGWGKAWNVPGRLLSASDAIFKTTAMSGELRAQAVRAALKEGLSGKALDAKVKEYIQNPTLEMVKAASDQAKFETFTTDPAKWTKAYIEARDKVPPVQYLTPFVNVPVNLLKRGFEVTPAGIFKEAIGKTAEGKFKAFDKATWKDPKVIDSFARAAIGTGIAIWAAQKYADGELTGKAPSDAGQRDAFLRTRQEYSVKIGDRWVRYTDFGPLAIPFLSVAAIQDARQINKNFPAEQVAMESIGALMNGIFQQSFYKGIADLTGTLGAGMGSFGTQFSRLTASQASGFVPFSGLFRSVKNLQDPTLRDPDTIYERIKAGLPILSETVPSKLNALGDEQKNSRLNGILGFGLRDTKVPNLDIEKELAKQEVSPRLMSEKLNIASEQFNLTRDQKRELQGLAGATRKNALRQLFSDQFEVDLGRGDNRETLLYSQMNDEQKKRAIENIISKSDKAARDEWVNRVNQRKEHVDKNPKKNKLQFVGAE